MLNTKKRYVSRYVGIRLIIPRNGIPLPWTQGGIDKAQLNICVGITSALPELHMGNDTPEVKADCVCVLFTLTTICLHPCSVKSGAVRSAHVRNSRNAIYHVYEYLLCVNITNLPFVGQRLRFMINTIQGVP